MCTDPAPLCHALAYGKETAAMQSHSSKAASSYSLPHSSCCAPALGNLCLVGRVLGVPPGIFQHVALDDRWKERAVVAHANEVLVHFVFAGHTPAAVHSIELTVKKLLVSLLLDGAHVQNHQLQHSRLGSTRHYTQVWT
eukprot:scaffold182415_cov31-Tisochrysis_lutea.AAC.1